MPGRTDRSRRTSPVAHATPASLLERLEPRVHLAAFAYQSLAEYLDAAGPLHVLRPSGDHGPAETLATSIAAIGDVDGDGVPDILVGSAGHSHGPAEHDDHHDHNHHRGALAAIYSGATGTLLLTVTDGARGYGSAVAGLGDVNGDGTPDFAVGSPWWSESPHAGHDHHNHDHHHGPGDHETGRVYIYSGADGTLLHTLTGEAERHRFGAAIAAAGDVDGDGVTDLLVGAPGTHRGGGDRDGFAGRVYLFSGADGSLIRTFNGADGGQRFGAAVAGAGDIDGDGTPDLIIGAPRTDGHGNDDPGSVLVLSGADGSTIFSFTGTQRRDLFGFAVAGGGDANGDGIPDIAVGAPGWRHGPGGPGNVPFAGQVTIFSGADGSVLHFVDGERPRGNLGASVSFAGDVDGDGADDLLIGQPLANPDARVIILSGDDGAVLGQFVARDSHLVRSDRLGGAAVALGDIDGDGLTDFALAGTKDAHPDHGDRSRVYIFSGVTVLPLRPQGITDEGIIWGTIGDGPGVREWIFLGGRVRLLSTVEGFTADDTIIDINNNGVILAARREADGLVPFIWENGQRTLLSDLITTFDGPDGTYVAMLGTDITDSGKILVQRLDDAAASTVWLLDGGTLTYLFDGVPVAMTERGIVVGLDTGGFDPGGPIFNTTIVLNTNSGEMTQIEDFFAVDVNASGAIVGLVWSGSTIRSAVWRGGTLTELPRLSGGQRFIAQAINDKGRVVGTYLRNGRVAAFYFDPATGIIDATSAVHGAPPTFTRAEDLVLADINNHGVVVGYTAGDVRTAFVLTPSATANPGLGRLGGRVDATLAADGTLSVITVNAMGETVIFRRDPRTGAWTATNLADDANTPIALDATTYTDPRTGRAVYIIASAEGLFTVTDAGNGRWTVAALSDLTGGTPITAGLTTFISLDGRVYIAGLDANGDLVAYHAAAAADGWTFENISVDHLAAGGAEVPMFEGRLVSYVTAWNGLNIAGLDQDGNIWVVWTSPVMEGRWTSSNLSEITQTPLLRGGLTPYLTPWGGINLAAVNADGETVVTWWVPSFGGHWARNNFTREFGFVRLRPESLGSFVTPWGGLNITGLDDDGRVVILWWAPATNMWQLARLTMGDDTPGPGPSLRRVDGYCAPDGSMNLLGIGHGGKVLRLHWRPDQPWLFEDLSDAILA